MKVWDEALFLKIGEKVSEDFMPEYHLRQVHQQYTKAMTIKDSIANLQMEIVQAEGEYQTIANKKTREIIDIQNDCKHEATTHHGDASGGSDSCDKCDICGKEL